MFSKSYSASLNGIHGLVVKVEADVSDGLPVFELVGLLASEVKEAKERVRIALRNQGFLLPPKRITINLSPADIRKEGTAYDLAIAIAILTASGYIPNEYLSDTMLIGELSLDGNINCVNGVLPLVSAAKEQHFLRCIVPMENLKEGSVIQGIEVYGATCLKEVVAFMQGVETLVQESIDITTLFDGQSKDSIANDFSDIVGQQVAKRAIEIAVAGQHNILLIGSPGSGKTMLAKRIPTIMPKLSVEESLDMTKIYSVSGNLKENEFLKVERPFRSPHHTITSTALIGGGRVPRPGEISLSAHGVLFLDELPEFDNRTLEVLRQPLEEKEVTITRLHASYTYPANFMLVAALNPCKCGYYPDRNRCNCSMQQIKQYLGKLSGPLLDRIDICVETMQIKYNELNGEGKEEASVDIRERICKARKVQLLRYKGTKMYFNSMLSPNDIKKYCVLGEEEKGILEKAFVQMNLSARAYHRILKVARTIADLAGSERILKNHLCEAISYRSIDKKYWGRLS